MKKLRELYKTLRHRIRLLFEGTRDNILNREFYVDEDIFKLEKINVFNKLWLFIGVTSELNAPHSWMIKKVINKEILVTYDGSRYYAVENVCPHKNMRLKSEKLGKGPLVCRYHAWSFQLDGSLMKIPGFDKSYLLTDSQMKRTCLKSFQIKQVGNFLFINLDADPMPFEKQFDTKIIRSLKLLSHKLSPEIGTFFEIRKFNWKLNFENLRDAMHPAVVHASTLAKDVDFSEQHVQQKPLTLNLRDIGLSEASSLSKDGEHKTEDRGHLGDIISPSLSEGYYNWLLYPNFHMATPDGGRSYSIEVLNPISPVETEISHYVLCNKPNDENDVFLEEVIEHRLRGLRPVLEEDYEACEEVQHALSFTELEQNIGAYEHYNANIASMYRRLIGR